tara:strand:+ start:108526 stop:108810 length:285 start_codon:yes stop_codon:yes gene_type:complete
MVGTAAEVRRLESAAVLRQRLTESSTHIDRVTSAVAAVVDFCSTEPTATESTTTEVDGVDGSIAAVPDEGLCGEPSPNGNVFVASRHGDSLAER